MFNSQTQDGYSICIPTKFFGYKMTEFIGCGGTCIVVKVIDESTNKEYAAKIISTQNVEEKNMTNSVEREIQVLEKLNHPNIIKIQETFKLRTKEDEFYVIVMEYCDKGDLLTYALKHLFKSEYEKKKIIYDVLDAIRYLHSKGISHGDIKSENILLDSNYNPKLCDFGFCRTTKYAGDNSKNGTLYYAAPELFVKGQFDSFKTDIWAIGITLYSLSELQFPFKDGDQNCIVRQILNARLSIRSAMEPKLKRLVEKCTAKNPELRPSIDDVIHDPYFFIGEKASKNNNPSKKALFNQCLQQSSQNEDPWSNSSLYDNVETFEPVFTI